MNLRHFKTDRIFVLTHKKNCKEKEGHKENRN